MDLQLSGQTALVTGATAGIGLEIARALADEGVNVIISGRDRAKLDKAIADIEAPAGAAIRGVLADAATAEGAAAFQQPHRRSIFSSTISASMRARRSATSPTPTGATCSTST
jgi:short-subunit dehydrogenase